MKNFFKNPNEKIFGLKDMDSDQLLYRVMPRFVMEIMRKYFQLEVEGVENIPRRGAALIAPNHSGFSGFDAMVLTHEIHRATDRVPRVLTHHLWFLTKATALPATKLGFIEANMNNGRKQLKKKNLVIVFPEGEYGNFKPSSKRYRLQPFKRGFLRMAILEQVPIIPTLVIGAEETHINLSQLKFTKYLRGLILPLPLNIIPLPAKWKIIFLKPIDLPYKPEAADDHDLIDELAETLREEMQIRLSEEVAKRERIFRKK